MTDTPRTIELEVEVEGTPEQVWEAIATGPGITSWYVPHEVDERPGGAAVARFGEGEGMEVPGRVAEWDPPRRVVFDGGGVDDGMAFEWTVEARDGGTCVVRLVNSGFGSGQPWDDQYDAMTEGWGTFLFNLQLHRRHFPGRHATPMLPGAIWSGEPALVFGRLTSLLGVGTAAVGDGVEVHAAGSPTLTGTLIDRTPTRLTLLLDGPCPGTAFIASEHYGGDTAGVSVWAYFYGEDRTEVASREGAAWQTWLDATT